MYRFLNNLSYAFTGAATATFAFGPTNIAWGFLACDVVLTLICMTREP